MVVRQVSLTPCQVEFQIRSPCLLDSEARPVKLACKQRPETLNPEILKRTFWTSLVAEFISPKKVYTFSSVENLASQKSV